MAVLEKVDPSRRLFLALSDASFEELSSMETFELVVERFHINLLVVRIADEEIDHWKT